MKVAHGAKAAARKAQVGRPTEAFSQRLVRALAALDYDVLPIMLDAREFGVPQRRSRLFVLGVRRTQEHESIGGVDRLAALIRETRDLQGQELGLAELVSASQAIGDLETSVNPTVGLSAKAGQVDIRITAKAATRAAAAILNAGMEQRVRDKVGQFIFGADDDTLEGVVARWLLDQHRALASVECGTGGVLGGRLAQLGEVFRGGVIIADGTLNDLAAVTEAARLIRSDRGSDLGLCASVIDAPHEVPRGLKLMIALVTPDGVKTVERGFGGHTALAGQWASTAALGLVWRMMKDEG